MQIICSNSNCDIVDLVEDEIHPGTAIVSGSRWSDNVTSTTFFIVDVDATRIDIRRSICQANISAKDISMVKDYFKIDISSLSEELNSTLEETGRLTLTLAQVVAASDISTSWDTEDIIEQETEQGTLVE